MSYFSSAYFSSSYFTLNGVLGVAAFAVAVAGTGADAQELTPRQEAFRKVYQELVEINTTNSVGRFGQGRRSDGRSPQAGGLPTDDVQVFSSGPRKGDLVARLHGTGARKPVLLVAHIDVVEARKGEEWGSDSFKLQEIDGKFRARGAIDHKAMASIFVANLIEYYKEGFKPDRDIILALTTDEELSNSPHDGAHWLLDNHRELVDAELAINEGGGGALRNGKPFRLSVQLAEKIYQSYGLEVKDRGGHSASGRRDNAIYRLADGLRRLPQFDFPVGLNAVTRSYFERTVAAEAPPTADAIKALLAGGPTKCALKPLTIRPEYNAMIRTTCVPTLLEAGHAENALPQTARATVNCRILPDQPVAEVERRLNRMIADEGITYRRQGPRCSRSGLADQPRVMEADEALAGEMWPGMPVIPTMSGGYTDSRWLRNAGIPSYGVSGLFTDPVNNGEHGLNEQVGVRQLSDGKEFLYRLVKLLAAPSRRTHGSGRPLYSAATRKAGAWFRGRPQQSPRSSCAPCGALRCRPGPAAMHGRAVVPHDDVAAAPAVFVARAGRRRGLRQLVDQLFSRGRLHAFDRIGMRGEIERAAAVDRILPDQAPALRRQRILLGDREIGSDLGARISVLMPGKRILERLPQRRGRAVRRRDGSRRIRFRRHARA